MFPSVTRPKPLLAIAGIVVLALAYIACAELGFSLAFTTKQVTAVWPPIGVAVAALLLFGRRVWPGIFSARSSVTRSHKNRCGRRRSSSHF